MKDEPSHILVVDDELSMRELLDVLLTREGYQVSLAENGKKALEVLAIERFDLLLCDIRLGDLTGLDVLRAAKQRHPGTVVIMISAYASTETAVEAMNAGAYDYLPKPFDNAELKQAIAEALDMRTLEREKTVLDHALERNRHFQKIVGNSPSMHQIYTMIHQVARTRTNILISGESGTGKELIAQAIHEQSDRHDRPFVAINCGGIPETLIESELFGHRKGSFTGATSDKKGIFDEAHGGTLFLDEIGDLNLPLQVKLLRVVQERVFKAVGGNADINVDIRFISATNKHLEEEVIAGRFREDLFYRLNVIEIKVPPLRERKDDLRALAQHFLEKYSREMGKEITKISSYAIDLLNRYDFPGNVRELENLMERSVALSTTNIILPDSLALATHKRQWKADSHFEPTVVEDFNGGVCLPDILEGIERAYLTQALEKTDGDKGRAAELLGINLRSLRYRIDKLDIGS
ncbi:MAG: sigma-54-dependent Fis family transcriptional regulator [Desulfobacterales bacterium]|nr:sigma-54-dependent Fis family transcriptional regulator [Desulfobacterales bacterium]